MGGTTRRRSQAGAEADGKERRQDGQVGQPPRARDFRRPLRRGRQVRPEMPSRSRRAGRRRRGGRVSARRAAAAGRGRRPAGRPPASASLPGPAPPSAQKGERRRRPAGRRVRVGDATGSVQQLHAAVGLDPHLRRRQRRRQRPVRLGGRQFVGQLREQVPRLAPMTADSWSGPRRPASPPVGARKASHWNGPSRPPASQRSRLVRLTSRRTGLSGGSSAGRSQIQARAPGRRRCRRGFCRGRRRARRRRSQTAQFDPTALPAGRRPGRVRGPRNGRRGPAVRQAHHAGAAEDFVQAAVAVAHPHRAEQRRIPSPSAGRTRPGRSCRRDRMCGVVARKSMAPLKHQGQQGKRPQVQEQVEQGGAQHHGRQPRPFRGFGLADAQAQRSAFPAYSPRPPRQPPK